MWKIERIAKKGQYDYAVVLDHPNRSKQNYVLHHRIVVENHLGRLLTEDEVVHHKNGLKKDNRIENLEVMGRSEHQSHHAKEMGRTYVALKCPWCQKIFERGRNNTFLGPKECKWTSCSNSCRGKFSRSIQLKGMTEEAQKMIEENVVLTYVRFFDTEEQELYF